MHPEHPRHLATVATKQPSPCADDDSLRRCVQLVRSCPWTQGILEAVAGPAFVLSADRQVVAANQRFLSLFHACEVDDVLGQRPGDAMCCRNAVTSPDGCGTTPQCDFCCINSMHIKGLQQQVVQNGECRLTFASLGNANEKTQNNAAENSAQDGATSKHHETVGQTTIDAEVVVSPVVIDNTPFNVVTMRDISADKRKQVLERVFFHDALNTAGALRGLVSMLQEQPSAAQDEQYVTFFEELCDRLIDIITQQRQLIAAESGDLTTRPMFVSVSSLLESVAKQFQRHDAKQMRTIVIGATPDVDIVTDASLARRVLENMIKNALEASPQQATITLDAKQEGSDVLLRVHNPGYMLPSVRHQIFQRSFSTKGHNRGIGTYSMRLFGEQYLGGKVWFTSTEHKGTTFVLQLPLSWHGTHSDHDW